VDTHNTAQVDETIEEIVALVTDGVDDQGLDTLKNSAVMNGEDMPVDPDVAANTAVAAAVEGKKRKGGNEPAYMVEYRERREQLEARIKGIKETALFRVKGDLYTKITPQDTSGDDVDNRYNLLVASLMAAAIKTYAHHCMTMLAERNSGELEDWIECLKDLHPVRAAVEGACNGAFGRNYFG
jgi:hypothetical protein